MKALDSLDVDPVNKNDDIEHPIRADGTQKFKLDQLLCEFGHPISSFKDSILFREILWYLWSFETQGDVTKF